MGKSSYDKDVISHIEKGEFHLKFKNDNAEAISAVPLDYCLEKKNRSIAVV